MPDNYRESILKLEEQILAENNGGLVFFNLIALDTLNKDSLRFEESPSVKIADSWVRGLKTAGQRKHPLLMLQPLFIGGRKSWETL
ncbi:MAG: hypothetical protein H6566_20895 [Lewinellaceae bacterium]|nr:hypothetical protein [Lewinellaceae bacterium]